MNKRFPPGFLHIIANETAERFSYYGMKAILVIFMTRYLQTANGIPDTMSEAEARSWYHLFSSANYFFPVLGAIIADIFWGKYKTIIRLSIVYCLGHMVLAFLENRTGLFCGLTLIAIGSGGIKPCVAAHLGDQFSTKNSAALSPAYAWFYLSINVGAFISTLTTPILLDRYGAQFAFGLPGLLMLLATAVFWHGRTRYRALPPVTPAAYVAQLKSPESIQALKSMAFLYFFIAFFWSLFDQTGSTWVLQLEKMNRTITIGTYQFEILASQLQALNPILILIFVPFCTQLLYPAVQRYVRFTTLKKITCGMALSSLSFLIIAYVENNIAQGDTPGVHWHVLAYGILTLAEVLVSIPALEFAYTQAPIGLKSLFGSFYLLSISLGNLITAGLAITVDLIPSMSGSHYFIFFAVLPLIAASILALWSLKHTEQSYLYEN